MPQPTSIVVYAAGAVSALGLSLQRHVGMVRAELAGGRALPMLLRGGESLRAGFVEDDALPSLLSGAPQRAADGQPLEGRLLRLAASAVREAAAAAPGAVPLYVAVPPPAGALPHQRQAAWLDGLWTQTEGAFCRADSRLYEGGASTFFSALAAAVAYVEGHHACVLVGAVDSANDGARLRHLDAAGRLARPTAADGVVPGEGACFLLLGPDVRMSSGPKPWARLGPIGLGEEPGHRDSGRPNLSVGLTCAFATALGPVPGQAPQGGVAALLASDDGSMAHAQEGAVACLRHAAQFGTGANVQRQVGYTGDAGVALPALQLATAAVHLRQGILSGPALLWTVDDDPGRGAVLLHALGVGKLSLASDAGALARAKAPPVAQAWMHRVDDTVATDAADLYLRWRAVARRGDFDDPVRRRIEERLEGALALLSCGVGRVSERHTHAQKGTQACNYGELRAVLAAGDAARVVDTLAAADLSREASRRAAVDALVHGWRPELTEELLSFFAAAPERTGILARVTSRLTLREARPWLLRELQPGGAPRHRAAVVRALAAVAGPEDRGALLLQLSRRSAPVRRAAALGLLRLGLRDEVWARRESTALGAWAHVLDGRDSRYASLLALDGRTSSRPQQTLALGAFGSPLAVPTLLERLASVQLRRHAEAALYLLTGARGQQADGWRGWWRVHRERFQVALRYRLGRPIDVHALLAALRDTSSPAVLRRVAGLELAIQGGLLCPLDRFLLVSQWKERLAFAKRHICASKSLTNLYR